MLKLEKSKIPKLTCRSTSSGYEIHDGQYCIAQGLTQVQAAVMIAGPILIRWIGMFSLRSPLHVDLKTLWTRLGIEPMYLDDDN